MGLLAEETVSSIQLQRGRVRLRYGRVAGGIEDLQAALHIPRAPPQLPDH